MSKLNIRNAASFQKFEIQNEVLDFFDEQEDKRHTEPRVFTLEFYNFAVGAGSAAIDVYRRFDHVLMTWSQAQSTMYDVANELADLIDANGNEAGSVERFSESSVEVCLCVYDEDTYGWYTAYVSIVEVSEVNETSSKIDVLDDRFWLSESELAAKELVAKVDDLTHRMHRLQEDHERTWSEWVWWVTEGRQYVERVCRDSERYRERYLAGRRYETRKEALNVLAELNETKAELSKARAELNNLQ